MAISQKKFRSISLPSRLDQVSSNSFESEFEKLKSGSASSDSIQSGLVALAQLYNSFEEIAQKSGAQSMEESLSQSVDLLDACSAIRDLLQMMRENVRALQSAMRRKGTDSAVQNDVAAYFSFRKKMQKTVAKTLRNLKKSESVIVRSGSSHSVNADGDFGFFFKQLAGITIANFRSVLLFLSYAAARPGGWSLVSKLVAAKSGKERDAHVNEVENLDLGLQGKMKSDVQKRLQIVDEIIEEFEGGFERLFRQLVQSRVILLNILTDQ